jgi:hypothetical protein
MVLVVFHDMDLAGLHKKIFVAVAAAFPVVAPTNGKRAAGVQDNGIPDFHNTVKIDNRSVICR